MQKGTIGRLVEGRGYGFIRTERGEDLFFHRSQLQGVHYNSLREGQRVEFEVGKGRNGRPQAIKVRLAQPRGEQPCHQDALRGTVASATSALGTHNCVALI